MPADNPDWTYLEAKNWRPGRRGDDVIPPVAGVVQHYTASTSSARAIATWFAGKSIYKGEAVAAPMASAHIVIGRDGLVIQQVPFTGEAFHAGEPNSKGLWMGKPQPMNVNWFTIGIENCNAGVLVKKPGGFFTAGGARYRGPEPERAPDHNGQLEWWEPYSEALIAANVEVLKTIVARYPKLIRENIQGHSDVAPYRKRDPGPLFPHDRILDAVFPAPDYDDDPDEDLLVLQANRGDLRHYDLDDEMCLEEPQG